MRKKLVILVSLSLVVLFSAFVGIPYFQDLRLPRATATLQFHPPDSLLPSGHGSEFTNPYEEVLNPKTLNAAVKRLNFGIPATEGEIETLQAQLKVTPVRGTDFINITAKHKSLQEAIRIANTVADAYLDQQTEIRRQHINEALEALNQELVDQIELTSDYWLAFVESCKLFGYQGPFFKDNLPEIEELESAHTAKLLEKQPLKDGFYDFSMQRHQFETAKEEYLQSKAVLDEMTAHNQNLREAFKAPDVLISIHERAK